MDAQHPDPELQWVNGERERYARVLQVGGDAPLHPWSIRPLGAAAAEASGDRHPWANLSLHRKVEVRGFPVTLLPLDARLIANSSFPFGFNEGPVWAGRGLTVAARAGAAATIGPVSVALSPVVFQAQNAGFAVMNTGREGALAFGFPYPWSADLPQRFGDSPYGRFDLGNSYVRLDAGPVTAGVSTAAQHWGPARDHPLILGSNAGGFPHVFLGSARPLRLGPILLHGRYMAGRLSQSRHTPMELVERRRMAVGIIGVVSPAGLPGLELGAGRFVHVLGSDSGFAEGSLLKPFGGLLGQTGTNAENQLASLFGRWVIPEAGIEVYGEFGKDDGNLSWRHLVIEPDHHSAYMIGVQRVLGGRPSGADSARALRRTVLRAEVLNTRVTTPHLIPPQSPWYVHSLIAQGHTHRGLALGSAGGFGGGASSVGFDRYTPAGRMTVAWSRIMRAEYLTIERAWVPIPSMADVYHALGVDGIRYRGRSAITYELTGVYEANRHFERDAFSLRAVIGARHAW